MLPSVCWSLNVLLSQQPSEDHLGELWLLLLHHVQSWRWPIWGLGSLKRTCVPWPPSPCILHSSSAAERKSLDVSFHLGAAPLCWSRMALLFPGHNEPIDEERSRLTVHLVFINVRWRHTCGKSVAVPAPPLATLEAFMHSVLKYESVFDVLLEFFLVICLCRLTSFHFFLRWLQTCQVHEKTRQNITTQSDCSFPPPGD